MSKKLPIEIKYLIISYNKKGTFSKYKLVNKEFNKICGDLLPQKIIQNCKDKNQILQKACYFNLQPLIEYCIKNYENLDYNYGLYSACRGGFLEIVELMISLGANDWNYSFYCACEGGNKEIVELIISKGANNWNDGLSSACEGGQKEIVELMITKGANDWNGGLVMACYYGNKEIVELMVSKGANSLREGLNASQTQNRQEIIEYFRTIGIE